MQRSYKETRGFTLVELMVTIAVIAIVLAVGVPSISQLRANSELTTATNELVAALNLARSEAVRRGETVSFGPWGTWADGWVVGVNQSDPLDPAQANWTTEYRRFDSPPGGIGIVTKTGDAVVQFEALGNVATAGCLEINGGDRSIILAASGRISNHKAACP